MDLVKHGGHIWEFAEERQIPLESVYDFSANINPIGPPQGVRDLLADSNRINHLIVNYPREDYQPLVSTLSSKFSIARDEIVLGNGATELLSRLIETQKSVMIPTPSYGEYLAICQRHSISVHLWNWDEACRDLTKFINHIEQVGPTAVVLPCPNNPTSDMMDLESMKDLFAKFPNIQWIVDASFLMFVEDSEEMLDFLLNSQAAVVMSLTKYYALPGLRLGWARLVKDQARELNAKLDPWRVNAVAFEAGVNSLKDKEFDAQTHQWLREEKDYILKNWKDRGLVCSSREKFPQANFFQLEFSSEHDKNLAIQNWKNKNMLVRDCESFGQFSRIRLAIKQRQENEMLLTVFLESNQQTSKAMR